MKKDEMYEHLKAQMRGTDVTALEALANTLKKLGTEMKPFYKGEKQLYVMCDGMPWTSIEIIAFLASSNGLTCRMEARPKVTQIDDTKITTWLPYINIYKL
jgi:hypothetical protein